MQERIWLYAFFFSKSSTVSNFFVAQNGIGFPEVTDNLHMKEWFISVYTVHVGTSKSTQVGWIRQNK